MPETFGQVVLVNVERMLDLRRKVERRLVECLQFATPAARQSLERGIGGSLRLRVDEVQDRFRLVVVELAVEKRPLREFAASRQPGAGGQAGRKNPTRRDRATMALELDDVFARVAAGTLEGQDDGLVEKSGGASRTSGTSMTSESSSTSMTSETRNPRKGNREL